MGRDRQRAMMQLTQEPAPVEFRPEAKQEDLEISEDAAPSRLRPIRDGPELWQEHRSSAATVPGGLPLAKFGQCSDLARRGSAPRLLISPMMTMSRAGY
jgi:hypothetical protein